MAVLGSSPEKSGSPGRVPLHTLTLVIHDAKGKIGRRAALGPVLFERRGVIAPLVRSKTFGTPGAALKGQRRQACKDNEMKLNQFH